MLRPLCLESAGWRRPHRCCGSLCERLRAKNSRRQRRIGPLARRLSSKAWTTTGSPSPPRPRPGHACRRCHRRRSPPPDMVADMQTVDLDDQQVELREVRGEPGLHLHCATAPQRPGNGRLRGAVATRFARSPSGRRTARWYLRVDTFRTIRPLEQQVAVAPPASSPNPPPCQHGREPVAAATRPAVVAGVSL